MRQYPEAQQYLNRSIALLPDQIDSYIHKAESLWLQQGETAAARVALEAMPATDHPAAARKWFLQLIFERKFDEAIERLERYPGDVLRHYSFARPKSLLVAKAHALAGLGLEEEAVQEGRRALEIYPLPHDAVFGIFPVADLALIQTVTGDHDAPLEQLGQLLATPSLTSIPLLKLDPRFAPCAITPVLPSCSARSARVPASNSQSLVVLSRG